MRGGLVDSSARYLHVGIVALAISGASALYLNFEGARCLTALSRPDSLSSEQQLEEARARCFIITNSYVYSLFGVAVGAILLALWASKRRKLGGRI